MGEELNNNTCSRLGTMLYLYIYKVKYEMNTYKFQHDIGDTAACMEIVMKDTKGCGKLHF